MVVEALPPEEVKKIAREIIRSEIGSVPSPGEPKLRLSKIGEVERWVYEVPIVAFYPVLIVDPITQTTRKVRFKNLGTIGKIIIDAFDGSELQRTPVNEIRRRIRAELGRISEMVDKILVKLEAKKFASLPLAEHIHTPIEDIISALIILDKIDISSQIEVLPESEKEKYLKILNALVEVGLVEVEGNSVFPGNILIGLEERAEKEGLSHQGILNLALAHFFEAGYEHVDTIRIVLGPFLVITRGIYEISLESEELVPVDYKTIQSFLEEEYYPKEAALKSLKLPRYLLQLERVELIEHIRKNGKDCWIGKESTFKKILQSEEISKVISLIV